ncbi:MAG TPA: TolC family protein, partial [Candidatus Solibacter sp.]|nr:TolC family protein [Candidatus Solibacter sp.]
MRRALLAVGTLLLAGCAMGPNYKRPAVPTPAAFRNAPAAGGDAAASIADTKWQSLFNDETLNQMVTRSLTNNFDLRIAAERAEEARAQLGITRANQYPFLDVQAGLTASRNSTLGTLPVPAGTKLGGTLTSIGAALSWEV